MGVLSQFLFEVSCGSILRSEQPCLLRESAPGAPWPRGACAPHGQAHGRPRVGGVVVQHVPGRSPQGGRGRAGGARHHAPRGPHVPPPTGGRVDPSPAPGVGQRAPGRDLQASQGRVAVSRACGGPGRPAPRRAAPRHEHAGRQCRKPHAHAITRGPASALRQGPSRPQSVEPDQRGGKRGPRPRLGCKSCAAAPDPCVGLARRPRSKTRQRVVAEGDAGRTAAAGLSALAASSRRQTGATAPAQPPDHTLRHSPLDPLQPII